MPGVRADPYGRSSGESCDPWLQFSNMFRSDVQSLPQPWGDMFGPLRKGAVDDLMVVAQIGQSLDGRVATETGHSKYINGPTGLAHLHRLRALVDGVVIGVGTAIADNPLLTVRRVGGPQPVRVVIDPKGRLGVEARVFAADGVRRLLIVGHGTACTPPLGVEVVALPLVEGQLAPAAILTALAEHGIRRVLVEGGANTVSRFLAAGCLDRLHVLVSPIIIGSGRASIILPEIKRVDHALRPSIRVHLIDDEVLFDCDLSAQRVRIGVAKTSI